LHVVDPSEIPPSTSRAHVFLSHLAPFFHIRRSHADAPREMPCPVILGSPAPPSTPPFGSLSRPLNSVGQIGDLDFFFRFLFGDTSPKRTAPGPFPQKKEAFLQLNDPHLLVSDDGRAPLAELSPPKGRTSLQNRLSFFWL